MLGPDEQLVGTGSSDRLLDGCVADGNQGSTVKPVPLVGYNVSCEIVARAPGGWTGLFARHIHCHLDPDATSKTVCGRNTVIGFTGRYSRPVLKTLFRSIFRARVAAPMSAGKKP